MKAGDLIILPAGPRRAFDLTSETALLIRKLPRTDMLEYDWEVFADGRIIGLGRQIEQNHSVIKGDER
jgi:hypothetical protein